ncbi:NS3-like protein [Wuhan cricket virus]|uniref:NS3-like protein n=1 Tax=Wuhan cricket virus TaxID=1746070 RepID=UPI00070631D9|nr:NS3-like protein [Wuhan cricket virus]ALL52919.1 NS3-like protein [Wuhan cricket virus]
MEELLGFLHVSATPASSRVFLSYITATTLCIAASKLNIYMLDYTIIVLFTGAVHGGHSFTGSKQHYIVAILFMLSGIPWMAIPIAMAFKSRNNGTKSDTILKIVEVVERAGNMVTEIQPSLVIPYAGSNAGWGEHVYEIANYWRMVVMDSLPVLQIKEILNVYAKAAFMRSNGLNDSRIPLAERVDACPINIYAKAKTALALQRGGTLLIIALACYLTMQDLMFASSVVLYIMLNYLDREAKTFLDVKAKSPPFKNGTYRISYHFLGLEVSYGVGVAFNGVMHVPYHVSGLTSLRLGLCEYRPYYSSVEEDLTTYGGPPQMVKPLVGQDIYINIETDTSRTTYTTRANIELESNVIAWQSVTKPGESGSPVFSMNDTGELNLVGQVGRFYVDMSGSTVGYAKLPDSSSDSSNENSYQVLTYPGSGKTTKILPERILKHLGEKQNGRVLVCGPTRPVCMEIYKALSEKMKVGLNIKDMPGLRNPFAQVQVASHHTAMTMLTESSRELNGMTLMIVDEAHTNYTATIMLRNYGQYLMDNGIEYLEMSATLDGKADRRSRYPIDDVMLSRADLLARMKEELEKGKRILVFVSSMRSTDAKDTLDGCKGFGILKVSRSSYAQAYPLLNDSTYQVIVSTEILECGANIYNLDCVFDFGKKFGYVGEGLIIHPVTRNISLASQTQRRGRVGRFKSGEFFYTTEPTDEQILTDADVDAQILMTGREWAPVCGNDYGIILSDKQFSRVMKNMEMPTWVSLATNSLGMPLTGNQISRRINMLRGEKVYNIGCGNSSCPCVGSWNWFDMRIHDWMINTRAKTYLSEL